jgi:preprotein translocase subunit SecA
VGLTQQFEAMQKRAEVQSFDVRKCVREYDDVLNLQRHAVYTLRRRLLCAEPSFLHEYIINAATQVAQDVVDQATGGRPRPKPNQAEAIATQMHALAPWLTALDLDALTTLSSAELKAFLSEELRTAYDKKRGELEAVKPGLAAEVERRVLLHYLDLFWRGDADAGGQLDRMENLRTDVDLLRYADLDALTEYKLAAYGDFLEMMALVREAAHLELLGPADMPREIL